MHVTAELQHEIRKAAHDVAGVSSFCGHCVTLAERGDYDLETLKLSLEYAEAKLLAISFSLGRDPRLDEAKRNVFFVRDKWMAEMRKNDK